jgi:hypothetical protein
MKLLLLLVGSALLALTSASLGGPKDETLEEGTFGNDVVYTVVRKINKELGPHGPEVTRFFYCLGYVTSDFKPVNSLEGGLWKINETWYNAIKNDNSNFLKQKKALILEKFLIDRNKTNWSDLEKPLYSGLAAYLHIYRKFNNGPELSINKQADQYAAAYEKDEQLGHDEFMKKVGDELDEYIICRGNFDLIGIMDASGSITHSDYDVQKNSLKDLVGSYTIGEHFVSFGLIVFSDNSLPLFGLDNNFTKDEILTRIANAQKPHSGTATHLALKDATTMFINREDKKRPAVCIVLTDGASNNGVATATAARDMIAANVTSYAIGIGSGPNYAELLTIAGNKPDHVFTPDDFDVLKELEYWLSTETCSLPSENPVNGSTQGSLEKNEKRYFAYEIPEEGLIIEVQPGQGQIRGFYAYGFDNPSSAYYDGIIDGKTFIEPDWENAVYNSQGQRTSFGKVYVTIEGRNEDIPNTFELISMQGEGCGLRGVENHVTTSKFNETTQAGQILWEGELFGPEDVKSGRRRFSINDADYLDVYVGEKFQIVAGTKFPKYIADKRSSVMHTSVQFDCSHNVVRNYAFTIPLRDENTEKPVFSPDKLSIEIQLPIDISQPINKNVILMVEDKDLDYQNANLKFTTSNPNISVQGIPQWDQNLPYPPTYAYKVELYYNTQPQQGIHQIIVNASDGVFSANVTIPILVKSS